MFLDVAAHHAAGQVAVEVDLDLLALRSGMVIQTRRTVPLRPDTVASVQAAPALRAVWAARLRPSLPLPPIRSDDLVIRGIGVQERMPPSLIDRTVGTGDHLVMQFYDEVWVAVGGALPRQPRNTFVIWTPGNRQCYGDREHPDNHTWIHFSRLFRKHYGVSPRGFRGPEAG